MDETPVLQGASILVEKVDRKHVNKQMIKNIMMTSAVQENGTCVEMLNTSIYKVKNNEFD